MRICLPVERLEQRKRNVAPLIDAFFAYLKYGQGHVAPKMKTGREISYCHQSGIVSEGISHRWCCPDDKQCCRAGDPPLYSGQNWYLIDAIGGAKSSAISIAETAKANNLKPYEYFKYLLEELPKHGEF